MEETIPQYKLTYYNMCVRTEVSRLVLAQAGMEYEFSIIL